MFEIQSCETQQQFLAEAGVFLERRSVENNLIIGLCKDAIRRNEMEPWLLLIIREQGDVIGAAIKTPQHKLLITRLIASAIPVVVDVLTKQAVDFPGVFGPAESAEDFAQAWSTSTGKSAKLTMGMGLYACDKVTSPARVPGSFRVAQDADVPWLVEWVRAFQTEVNTGDSLERVAEMVAARTTTQKLWIWDDNGPVSLAGYSRETEQGAAIVQVYTPPEFRQRGYASACVAALTQQLLDSGKSQCWLYADSANPTSNHIYQSIGYKLVSQSASWHFSSLSEDE